MMLAYALIQLLLPSAWRRPPRGAVLLPSSCLAVAAMLLNSALLTLPLLVTTPLLIWSTRRYLRRAPQGYITEGGTYSQINTSLSETVEGARTVEALRLQRQRKVDADPGFFKRLQLRFGQQKTIGR